MLAQAMPATGRSETGFPGTSVVAPVEYVGATIMPGCFGNRGLSCRGTKSSNPSPSRGESANHQQRFRCQSANFRFLEPRQRFATLGRRRVVVQSTLKANKASRTCE